MLRAKILILILTGLFITIPANAQEVRNMTLDEAVKIGLENSHQLHSSQMAVQFSEARFDEVVVNRLPSLSLNAFFTRFSPVEPFSIQSPLGNFDITQNIPNTYNIRLVLRQPLFTGFRLTATRNIAEYNYLASKEDFSADRNTLVYNIKSAYWNVFMAKEVKKVVDENVAQVKAHLEDVQNLFKQGLATRNDLLTVQVQLSEAHLRQIDANNGLRVANVNFNNVINLPLSTEIVIQEQITPASDNIQNIDELTERAYKNRPELRAMDFRLKASESGITAAKSSWWPQIFFEGHYDYARPNPRVFPATDEFSGSWDVGISLQMNLWNWGQTIHQTTQAEAQYEQTRDNYETLRDAVALELTQTYLNVLRAKERVFVAEENISQAEENYRVTSEKFKNGLVLNTDLIDAEVDLLQARTNHVQSLVDYELAKANLEKAIGQ